MLTKQPQKTLYARLKNHLLDKIETMPNGSRLDSVRAIMSEYGVSLTTANRAIGELKDEGYLESQWGKGLFVNKIEQVAKANGISPVFDAFVFGHKTILEPNGGFHSELLNRIGHDLGECNFSLRLSNLPYESSLKELLDRIEELDPKFVILVNLDTPVILEILKENEIPYILLLPNCYQTKESCILVNNRQSVSLSINHLYDLGHRDIACLHGVDDDHPHYVRDINQRLKFYYEEMGRLGIPVDPDIVQYAGWSFQEGYDATMKIIKSGKKFTAMIINDHIASGVYKALDDSGLKVPDDVSVIGHDDLSWCEHLNPPLTTIRTSRSKISEITVERCNDFVAGKEVVFPSVEMPVELIERASTAKVRY